MIVWQRKCDKIFDKLIWHILNEFFELKNTGLHVWERNVKEREVVHETGFSFTEVAPALVFLVVQIQFLQSHLLLTFSSPRWERTIMQKKHLGTWLEFPLHLPKPHCRCILNPTHTKAVRPDGGRRNYSETFSTVIDGKHWSCRRICED